MLLIITNQEDIHPNPVIDLLIEREIGFFRLNTESLFTHYDVVYEISKDKTFFEISYKDGSHSINSDQITCVWERRPCEPLATYDNFDNKEVSKLLLDEGDGFLKFFRYSMDNLPWIGDAVLERKAGSKILQKIIAKKIGFNIPKTVFTNRIKDLDLFESNEIAIKPISAFGLEKDQENSIIFYTSKKTKEDIKKSGKIGFRNTINFFESYIKKSHEIRVTYIKNEAFTVSINSQSFDVDKGSIDWRQGYDHGIQFKAIDIPKEIEQKCLEFLNYFGLMFGCFDFIVDENGTYHFLECNTNGQWMWIEEEAKLPISKKLADVFTSYAMNNKAIERIPYKL